MSKSYSVTSAGINPEKDRAHRMRMYYMAMALRVLCVVSLFWVQGWWVVLVALGAVILPWFAVMVGNAVAHGGEEDHDTPEAIQIEGSEPPKEADEAPAVIVIDVEPARRASSAVPNEDTPDHSHNNADQGEAAEQEGAA